MKAIARGFIGAIGVALVGLIAWALVTKRVHVDGSYDWITFLFASALGPSFICIGFRGPRNFVSGITGVFIHGPVAIGIICMGIREVVIDEGFWTQGITMIHLVSGVIVLAVLCFCILWMEYCVITVFGEKGRKFVERYLGWKFG